MYSLVVYSILAYTVHIMCIQLCSQVEEYQCEASVPDSKVLPWRTVGLQISLTSDASNSGGGKEGDTSAKELAIKVTSAGHDSDATTLERVVNNQPLTRHLTRQSAKRHSTSPLPEEEDPSIQESNRCTTSKSLEVMNPMIRESERHLTCQSLEEKNPMIPKPTNCATGQPSEPVVWKTKRCSTSRLSSAKDCEDRQPRRFTGSQSEVEPMTCQSSEGPTTSQTFKRRATRQLFSAEDEYEKLFFCRPNVLLDRIDVGNYVRKTAVDAVDGENINAINCRTASTAVKVEKIGIPEDGYTPADHDDDVDNSNVSETSHVGGKSRKSVTFCKEVITFDISARDDSEVHVECSPKRDKRGQRYARLEQLVMKLKNTKRCKQKDKSASAAIGDSTQKSSCGDGSGTDISPFNSRADLHREVNSNNETTGINPHCSENNLHAIIGNNSDNKSMDAINNNNDENNNSSDDMRGSNNDANNMNEHNDSNGDINIVRHNSNDDRSMRESNGDNNGDMHQNTNSNNGKDDIHGSNSSSDESNVHECVNRSESCDNSTHDRSSSNEDGNNMHERGNSSDSGESRENMASKSSSSKKVENNLHANNVRGSSGNSSSESGVANMNASSTEQQQQIQMAAIAPCIASPVDVQEFAEQEKTSEDGLVCVKASKHVRHLLIDRRPPKNRPPLKVFVVRRWL